MDDLVLAWLSEELDEPAVRPKIGDTGVFADLPDDIPADAGLAEVAKRVG